MLFTNISELIVKKKKKVKQRRRLVIRIVKTYKEQNPSRRYTLKYTYPHSTIMASNINTISI